MFVGSLLILYLVLSEESRHHLEKKGCFLQFEAIRSLCLADSSVLARHAYFTTNTKFTAPHVLVRTQLPEPRVRGWNAL